MKPLFCAILTLFFFSSCSMKTLVYEQKSGIFGEVFWLEGNFMPMITEDGVPAERNTGKPVQREIWIFEVIKSSDLIGENGFYKVPEGIKPIARIKTDANGKFFYALPPGNYSILSMEEGGLWANLFDGENHINPITITENEIFQMRMEINYVAAY